MRAPGRLWWRVWGPPVLVIMIELAMLAFGGPNLRAPAGWPLVLILTGCVLALRLWFPRTVAAVTIASGTAFAAFSPHTVTPDVAAVVALYTLATLTDRRTAATFGAVAAVVLTASSIAWLPSHLLDIRNLVPLNYVAAAVAVGDSVRSQRTLLHEERRRARQAELTRDTEARQRVRDERIRIARDLHDVVAHHLTLVNAQAGVARHLLRTDPDRAYQALAGIQQTSRAALDELRATVGLLRQDNEPDSRQPTPTFDQVDDLLGAFRTAGFDVTLRRRGTVRPLTGPADLAAYRILQETLTNASKHATTPHVAVDLTYTDRTLELTVTNAARPDHRGAGSGHGLIGLRERAESAGGHFHAARRPDGTYLAHATLPLTEPGPPDSGT